MCAVTMGGTAVRRSGGRMRWREVEVEDIVKWGVGAPGIHQFRADLDVESCWLGRGPLH